MLNFKKSPPKNELTRVLVIDDEPSFTRMVKVNLEDAGSYSVETVNESPQALERAINFDPHIILLDVVMPEADGGDVATRLRKREATREIPIIFVSAMVSRKESEAGLYQSGGEQFLAKPVNTKTLVTAINTLLAKKD